MTNKRDISASDEKRANNTEVLRLSSKLKRVEHEKAVLESQIKILNAELNRSKHIIQLMKDLYFVVDGKIMRLLNRRGYARAETKLVRAIALDPYSKNDSIAKLLDTAYEYDIKNSFNYNTKQIRMKFGYRVGAKAYRSARDITVLGLRKSYKLARTRMEHGSE